MATPIRSASPSSASITKVIDREFSEFNAPSWRPWLAFLSAVFGLPLSGEARDLVLQCTGRTEVPTAPAREAWAIVGRRGGKSRIAALLAVFLAVFRKYTLAPGERGVVMIVASDRRQARVVLRYARALIKSRKKLDALVEGDAKESIDLSNGISIEVMTANARSTRGWTCVGCVLDELAFWQSDEDSANPDIDVIRAIRPAMASVPGALLVAISSPYAKRGALWSTYRDHFGKNGDPCLVWRAASAVMAPELSADVIAEAYATDEASASAEYGAEFRSDLETFLSREALERLVIPGRIELPPQSGTQYRAFADPSGGSADSFTMAIAHVERDKVVIDAVRERRPPFSPNDVVQEFSELLKRYSVYQVTTDAYAGIWPVEVWATHGIRSVRAEQPKSELYRSIAPLVNSGTIELPDEKRLIGQLASLERRTGRGGRDTIDHPLRGHDDVANAVAGVATLFSLHHSDAWFEWVKGEVEQQRAADAAAAGVKEHDGVHTTIAQHGPAGADVASPDNSLDGWGRALGAAWPPPT